MDHFTDSDIGKTFLLLGKMLFVCGYTVDDFLNGPYDILAEIGQIPRVDIDKELVCNTFKEEYYQQKICNYLITGYDKASKNKLLSDHKLNDVGNRLAIYDDSEILKECFHFILLYYVSEYLGTSIDVQLYCDGLSDFFEEEEIGCLKSVFPSSSENLEMLCAEHKYATIMDCSKSSSTALGRSDDQIMVAWGVSHGSFSAVELGNFMENRVSEENKPKVVFGWKYYNWGYHKSQFPLFRFGKYLHDKGYFSEFFERIINMLLEQTKNLRKIQCRNIMDDYRDGAKGVSYPTILSMFNFNMDAFYAIVHGYYMGSRSNLKGSPRV